MGHTAVSEACLKQIIDHTEAQMENSNLKYSLLGGRNTAVTEESNQSNITDNKVW